MPSCTMNGDISNGKESNSTNAAGSRFDALIDNIRRSSHSKVTSAASTSQSHRHGLRKPRLDSSFDVRATELDRVETTGHHEQHERSVDSPEDDNMPEGIVTVMPEAPDDAKDSQLAPEMLDGEPIESQEGGRPYTCTVCLARLYPNQPKDIRQHPKLNVIVCKSCYEYYMSGDIVQDEEGLDEQCSWCGQGGNLYVCDYCTAAFCKKCLKRNLKRDKLKAITDPDNSWRCLICNPKPIYKHRHRYGQLQDEIKQLQQKEQEALERKRIKKSHKRDELIPRTDNLSSGLIRPDYARGGVSPIPLLRDIHALASIVNGQSVSTQTQHSSLSASSDFKSLCSDLNERIQSTPLLANAKVLNAVIVEHNRVGRILEGIKKEYDENIANCLPAQTRNPMAGRLPDLARDSLQKKLDTTLRDTLSQQMNHYLSIVHKFTKENKSRAESYRQDVASSSTSLVEAQEPLIPTSSNNLAAVPSSASGSNSLNLFQDSEYIDINDLARLAFGDNRQHRTPTKSSVTQETIIISDSEDSDVENSNTAKQPVSFSSIETTKSDNKMKLETSSTNDAGNSATPSTILKDSARSTKRGRKNISPRFVDYSEDNEGSTSSKSDSSINENRKRHDATKRQPDLTGNTSPEKTAISPQREGSSPPSPMDTQEAETALPQLSLPSPMDTMETDTPTPPDDIEIEAEPFDDTADTEAEADSADTETPPDAVELTTPEAGGLTSPNATVLSSPDAAVLASPNAGELTATDAGKLTAPDAGELTAPDAGELISPDAARLIFPDVAELTTPDAEDTLLALDDTPGHENDSTSLGSETENRLLQSDNEENTNGKEEDVKKSVGSSDSAENDEEDRARLEREMLFSSSDEDEVEPAPKSLRDDSHYVDDGEIPGPSGYKPKRSTKPVKYTPPLSGSESSTSQKEKLSYRDRLKLRNRREQKIDKLQHDQKRYAISRARGLIVQLKERTLKGLSKLLQDIESKSIAEMDPDKKLEQRCEIALERLNLEDQEVVESLITKNRKPVKAVERAKAEQTESDIEVEKIEKEIRRFSKFETMVRSKAEIEVENKMRKVRNKPKEKASKTSRRFIDSDSDLSSVQSETEDAGDKESSEEEPLLADVIVMPNQDQLDNERAVQDILNDMTDSDMSGISDDELSDSGSASQFTDSSIDPQKPRKKTDKKRSKRPKRHCLENLALDSGSDSSEDEVMPKRSKRLRKLKGSSSSSSSESDRTDRRRNETSDSDSSLNIKVSRRKRKRYDSSLSSSSDGASSGSSSDKAIGMKTKSRAGKMKTKKKRRIVTTAPTSTSNSSDSDVKVVPEPSTPTKGRQNIRKVIDDKKLKADTRKANKLETERRKRIEQKRKEYEELLAKVSEKGGAARLILEADKDGEPVIEVDPSLVENLKPHQRDAVRHMWDCLCESIERTGKGAGSGTILAHCMGLGKTLSLIAFVHTLLSYEDKLKLKRILVICPLNTVLNWLCEVKKWTSQLDIKIKGYEMTSAKQNHQRLELLRRWFNNGGIMIIGYEMFRNLAGGARVKNKEHKDKFSEYLLNPGADIIVCDEGHLLKNKATNISKVVTKIHSLRRIVLTGTPLQNNLKEYYVMVDFVKPKLLGSGKEFANRFENPIRNGSFEDSSAADVRLMKKRAHVLHQLLAGVVQRKDYSILADSLPPKQEYILKVPLSDLQIKLYERYLELIGAKNLETELEEGQKFRTARVFRDFQSLSRVWNHPRLLKMHSKRLERENGYDSFIDDESECDNDILVNEEVAVSGDDETWVPWNKKTKKDSKADKEDSTVNKPTSPPPEVGADVKIDPYWWKDICSGFDLSRDVTYGPKFTLLMEILKDAYAVGDRVLLFSQSILVLDLIEDFLELIDIESARSSGDPRLRNLTGELGGWVKGKSYFRIDGSVEGRHRTKATDVFNKENNYDARLFLISTRAGGMGINLVGANRVIIFDASWNPSHDLQAIFRAYRFGQNKPVFVYRFLSQGTMEEKIYHRQIAKLSISERVVDEHQIERHYTSRSLAELYGFAPERPGASNETPILPTDPILASILGNRRDLILSIAEHDSLLEHQMHENLTEEERKMAWDEYNSERERNEMGPAPQLPVVPHQVIHHGEVGMHLKPDIRNSIYQMVRRRLPNASENDIRRMTAKYVEQAQRKLIEQARYREQMQHTQAQIWQHQQQQMLMRGSQPGRSNSSQGQGDFRPGPRVQGHRMPGPPPLSRANMMPGIPHPTIGAQGMAHRLPGGDDRSRINPAQNLNPDYRQNRLGHLTPSQIDMIRRKEQNR